MAREILKWPVVIRIGVGANVSNVINAKDLVGCTAFTLFSSTRTDAFTYTIEVSYDDGTTYVTLNDGTADIAAPATGKAIAYANPPCTNMRIKSSSNATGNNDWYMVAEVPIFGLR
jgi:hypothetical protein